MERHIHQSGVCVGNQVFGQQMLEHAVDESRVEIVSVPPGKTVSIQNTMRALQSLLVAVRRGALRADLDVAVGNCTFNLNRGPLQWTSTGHFAASVNAAEVEAIRLTNNSSVDQELVVVIGFEPLDTPVSAAESATEELSSSE